MMKGPGSDLYVSWFVDGWQDVAVETRKWLFEQARYEVYRSGGRRMRILVSTSCAAFVLAFVLFVLVPLLWAKSVVWAGVGALMTSVIVTFANEVLFVYLISDRLRELVDSQ